MFETIRENKYIQKEKDIIEFINYVINSEKDVKKQAVYIYSAIEDLKDRDLLNVNEKHIVNLIARIDSHTQILLDIEESNLDRILLVHSYFILSHLDDNAIREYAMYEDIKYQGIYTIYDEAAEKAAIAKRLDMINIHYNEYCKFLKETIDKEENNK